VVTNRRPEPEEVRAAWDALAPYRDEQTQAGNTWQRDLIQPAVERLLRIAPGELVLEIACGNGLFTRRMAELGARVLGTDFSEPMLDRAHGGDIEYRLADAADETALLALGEPGSFDAVVCNMAIMDMVEIEPMIVAAAKLLRRDGRFVFSTVHPAFNGEATRVLEQSEDERGVVRTYSVKVSRYIRPSTQLGVALEGQPVVQWYFHRPLTDLLQSWFRHGFVLDGIEEPVLAPDAVPPGSTSAVFSEVPPILVARMRRCLPEAPRGSIPVQDRLSMPASSSSLPLLPSSLSRNTS
jgi:2-polyprenyl-3-methyl-5-hydroxy-6-metoxy-1,4-benzoquinol methylase